MPNLTSFAMACTERGMVPDLLVRAGIRRLLDARLDEIDADDTEAAAERAERFLAAMRRSPVALVPDKANEQHYELPAEFFAAVLGPRRKYSSAWWPTGVNDLATAEEAALADTARHAGIADGQQILELGCGWGSLTLWMAEQFPGSRIIAVSNSHSQREYIADKRCAGASTTLKWSPATSTHSIPAGTSTAWSRWRCSSTCATGRRSSAACRGWLRPGWSTSSCTCSPIAARPMHSR